MANRIWRGDAVPIAQVIKATPADVEIGDEFILTINGKSVVYIAQAQSVIDVTSGLTAAVNGSDIPEFREILAEDFGDYLTLTARDPGVPFEVTASTKNTLGGNVIVEQTTPGFAGRNEVQKLELIGSYTDGTFTISWDPGGGTETTAGIAYDATAFDVQTALENLTTPTVGDFFVTGQVGGPWYVTFKGTYAESDVNLMVIDGTNLVGNGDVVIKTITQGSQFSNTIQYYVINASGGNYTLSLYGEATQPIAFSASAEDVQSALEGISSIGEGNVIVYGAYLQTLGGRRVYFVEFVGELAGQSVDLLGYDPGTLGGAGGNEEFEQPPQSVTVGGVSNQRVVLVDYHEASGGDIRFHYNGNSYATNYSYGISDLEQLKFALANVLGLWGSYYGRAGLFAIKLSSTDPMLLDTFSVDGSELSGGSASSTIIQYEGLSGGANEVQQVWISATGGTFDLTFDGETASGIAWDASAATIESNLEALSNITGVAVTGSGTNIDPWVITFDDPGAEDVPELTGDPANLTGGGGTVITVTTAAPHVDEVQTITLGVGVTGGSFTLAFDGEPTTGIAFNANAAAVESALEALIGIDDVTVTGSGPLVVTFDGPLVSGQNVALLVADGTDLIGGAGTETLVLETTTFSAGPNHFNDSLNFTGGRVPDTGDVLYVDDGTVSILFGLRMRSTFTVDPVTDELTLSGGDFVEDQIVRVRSTDTLPAGLAADTDYYIVNRNRDADTLQLATTSGGAPIDLTDAGTGQHTIEVQLSAIRVLSRYAGHIGLPRWNAADYWEYRPTYLAIGLLNPTEENVTIGAGDGSGSNRLRFDFGDSQFLLTLLETGGSLEPGVPPCLILGSHADNELQVLEGDIGVAFFSTESSVLSRLVIRGGRVTLGNVSLGELDKTAGELIADEATLTGALTIRG